MRPPRVVDFRVPTGRGATPFHRNPAASAKKPRLPRDAVGKGMDGEMAPIPIAKRRLFWGSLSGSGSPSSVPLCCGGGFGVCQQVGQLLIVLAMDSDVL